MLWPGDVTVPQSIDPNWLFSTEAQAAAALVAIIGGFLVSRLVALSVERQGLQRRFDELNVEGTRLDKEATALRADIIEDEKGKYLRKAIEPWVAAKGSPLEDLIPDLPDGIPTGTVRQWQDELTKQVTFAFTQIEQACRESQSDPRMDELLQAKPTLNELHQPIVTQVLRKVKKDRLKARQETASQFGGVASLLAGFDPNDLNPISPILSRSWEDISPSRWPTLRALEDRARIRRTEADLVETHLEQISSPSGVGWGIASLGLLAASGIALPLILMALRPVPTAWWARYGTVAAFVLGLVAVIAFIQWQWSQLKDPKGRRRASENALLRRSVPYALLAVLGLSTGLGAAWGASQSRVAFPPVHTSALVVSVPTRDGRSVQAGQLAPASWAECFRCRADTANVR
jgi:hypothetical protein